ncbi:type IV pilus modification PilV family protein [Thermostilla marina]
MVAETKPLDRTGVQVWRARARGFTMIEAVVAIAVTVIAATAVFSSLASLQYQSDDTRDRFVAELLAQQLMDEILGKIYAAYGDAYGTTLTANTWEKGTGTRERYNDIDDFNGWEASPPQDAYGVPLGTENDAGGTRPASLQSVMSLDGWKRSCRVYYVDETTFEPLSAGQTSDYRAVEVVVSRTYPDGITRELARKRYIVSHIPSEDW